MNIVAIRACPASPQRLNLSEHRFSDHSRSRKVFLDLTGVAGKWKSYSPQEWDFCLPQLGKILNGVIRRIERKVPFD